MVRMKWNDRIFAMKTLNKWEMLKRAEVRGVYVHWEDINWLSHLPLLASPLVIALLVSFP